MSTTSEKVKRAARENGKKGGRPKGKKTQAVLERDAVLKEFRQRVARLTDRLLDAQLTRALGQTFLYKVEKYYETVTDDKGKQRRVLRRKPPELVTEEWEIRAYLDGEVKSVDLDDEGVDPKDPEATYYFLTTKEPDSKAIDSMLNRTFGKAVQAVALTDKDGQDIIDDETRKKAKAAVAAALGGAPRAGR